MGSMITVEERRDPDALLRQLESEEAESRRGRLKVFLGYASGVGKSFRMLDEGRRRRERGQDVVVAAIQPKISDEVAAIVDKLEVIPLKPVNGIQAMDVDAVLVRKPGVALVDGLAYDNPPGSKNAKRWQDVEGLLEAGISVITSVNIQFIAELQGQVEVITGKHISDSVPQSFISSADEIVVVDSPPESCFVRSSQTGEEIRVIEDRLSALRELALLLAADVVDRQLEAYLSRHGLATGYGTQERILVCLSTDFDASEMLVSGKRSAERFHSDLFVVYVRDSRLTNAQESCLHRNLDTARRMGACVFVIEEDDAIDAILEFARLRGITQIFVGHSGSKKWFQRISGSSLDRLIRSADGFDVKVFPH
jgi:two-component system, OmpR family, sensor histidine kinase KdpD